MEKHLRNDPTPSTLPARETTNDHSAIAGQERERRTLVRRFQPRYDCILPVENVVKIKSRPTYSRITLLTEKKKRESGRIG